jgi:hypothetical protein
MGAIVHSQTEAWLRYGGGGRERERERERDA